MEWRSGSPIEIKYLFLRLEQRGVSICLPSLYDSAPTKKRPLVLQQPVPNRP